MFGKILVCVDGSELAEQILPYVTEVASRFDSKVVLLQIVTIPSAMFAMTSGVEAGPPPPEVTIEQVKMEEKTALEYMERMAQPLLQKGVDVEWITIQGVPHREIVRYARENQVELIAMTTHGRSGLGRVVYGSVVDFVMRKTGLPMLVIKPQSPKE
ncbi:MAG: universal stress protein [Dehalococcoidia bacterium]